MVAVGDQPAECLDVAAQLGQGGTERLASLGIPLAAVDVDIAMRPFDVDQVDRVRRDDRQIDLEHLAAAPDLEVVQDRVRIRQMIAQMSNRLPLRVVDRLPNCDHLGHQASPSIADSTK
jgi:hypothetical protein